VLDPIVTSYSSSSSVMPLYPSSGAISLIASPASELANTSTTVVPSGIVR
jgi:hypothetical protein